MDSCQYRRKKASLCKRVEKRRIQASDRIEERERKKKGGGAFAAGFRSAAEKRGPRIGSYRSKTDPNLKKGREGRGRNRNILRVTKEKEKGQFLGSTGWEKRSFFAARAREVLLGSGKGEEDVWLRSYKDCWQS